MLLPILALFTTFLPCVSAGRSATSLAKRAASEDLVLYWGQASAGSQESLASYCQNSPGDIYIISFISSFGGSNELTMNIAGYNDYFSGTGLLDASALGEEIKTCQSLGKKVMISLGGAAGTYGFTSDSNAEDVAEQLWNYLGGGTSSTRPFGDAVIDGFDLDSENNLDTEEYAAFVTKMRELYATDTSKTYYMSAAPQCPYPDASIGYALANAYFDFVNIQFYNNYCSLASTNFNLDTWQTYATTVSPNPNIRLMVGLGGSTTACGSGYVDPSVISAKMSEFTSYANFGGFMVWDASQANTNIIDGESFAKHLESLLTSGSTTTTTTVATTSAIATTSTSTAAAAVVAVTTSTTTPYVVVAETTSTTPYTPVVVIETTSTSTTPYAVVVETTSTTPYTPAVVLETSSNTPYVVVLETTTTTADPYAPVVAATTSTPYVAVVEATSTTPNVVVVETTSTTPLAVVPEPTSTAVTTSVEAENVVTATYVAPVYTTILGNNKVVGDQTLTTNDSVITVYSTFTTTSSVVTTITSAPVLPTTSVAAEDTTTSSSLITTSAKAPNVVYETQWVTNHHWVTVDPCAA